MPLSSFRLRLDGQRVSGDTGRIWYAVIECNGPEDWHVSVFHPKDKPGDVCDGSCACISEADCRDYLFDEKYVRDAWTQNFLPADYEPPLELTAGEAIIKALELARANLRDMSKGWPQDELHEPLEDSIKRITELLNDGYDIETGELSGQPVRPNQKSG